MREFNVFLLHMQTIILDFGTLKFHCVIYILKKLFLEISTCESFYSFFEIIKNINYKGMIICLRTETKQKEKLSSQF